MKRSELIQSPQRERRISDPIPGIHPTLHLCSMHLFDTYSVPKIVPDCRYTGAIEKSKFPAGTELTV